MCAAVTMCSKNFDGGGGGDIDNKNCILLVKSFSTAVLIACSPLEFSEHVWL